MIPALLLYAGCPTSFSFVVKYVHLGLAGIFELACPFPSASESLESEAKAG